MDYQHFSRLAFRTKWGVWSGTYADFVTTAILLGNCAIRGTHSWLHDITFITTTRTAAFDATLIKHVKETHTAQVTTTAKNWRVAILYTS